jgi:hypothetical protein
MVQINFAPGIEDGGMATMIADIIKGNIKEKPFREKDFNALDGNIYMQAEDADVDMTMAFMKGSLLVHNGKVGKPKLSIVCDSSTLLDLANVSVKLGLPNYFDKVGLGVIQKLLTRKLKLKGLLTHPVALIHFQKLMSVR